MKMEYKEFRETLKTVLENCLEEKVYFETLSKINQVDKEFLVIERTDERAEENIVPVIALTDLHEAYTATGDFERCITELVNMYYGCLEEARFIGKEVRMPWKEAAKRIEMRLVKKEWNEILLKQVPYQEYLDLAVVFYVQIRKEEGRRAVFTVNNEIAKNWKVSLEDLWEAAWENLKREPISVVSLETVLCEKFGEGEEAGEEADQCEAGLYVMSNPGRDQGARAVLRRDQLRRLAEEQESNFYLLPSSVHEWILCKAEEGLDVLQMKRIVCEINRNHEIISPEECLSDSIYYYDREKAEVRIVA